MGENGRLTGSQLLGTELKRLRAGRTLAQVAELSRSVPLSSRIRPISAPTLCQLESGISFPTLPVLQTLGVIYQTSLNRLLDLTVQERIASDESLPDSLPEITGAFAGALQEARWHSALSLAIRGEQLAGDDAAAIVAWRGNRAICLQRLGQRDEAVLLLLECADDTNLPEDRRHRVLHALADAHASAGHLSAAIDAARRGRDCAPETSEPPWCWAHAWQEAHLLMLQADASGSGPDERAVRRALELLTQVESHVADDDARSTLQVRVTRAVGQKLLGNTTWAREELQRIAGEAADSELSFPCLSAWLNLGLLHHARGEHASAKRALNKAEPLALEEPHVDEAFELYFQLQLIAEVEGDDAQERLFKRCLRYYPLVKARTPSVKAFEDRLRRQEV